MRQTLDENFLGMISLRMHLSCNICQSTKPLEVFTYITFLSEQAYVTFIKSGWNFPSTRDLVNLHLRCILSSSFSPHMFKIKYMPSWLLVIKILETETLRCFEGDTVNIFCFILSCTYLESSHAIILHLPLHNQRQKKKSIFGLCRKIELIIELI